MFKIGVNMKSCLLIIGGMLFSYVSIIFAQENVVSSLEEKKIKVSFLSKQLTIEVEPAGAGTVTKTPNKTIYDDGEKVTLQANPSGGYEFLHWSGDIDRFSRNPVNIHMEENRTIKANFVKQDEQKVSTPNRPNGKSNVTTGEWINFHASGATSNIGGSIQYLFSWGDGRVSTWGGASQTYAYGKSGTYKVKVRARSTADPYIVSAWSAEFNVTVTGPDKHILFISVSPNNGGTVEINPDKQGYDDGDQVRLRAIPNAGFRFVRWSDGLKSTNNPVNIYMLKTRSITANFEEEGGGGGTDETVSQPDKPTGTTSGQVGTNFTFQTGNSVSSLGHDIEYQFDFGDGSKSSWGGPERVHQYNTAGTFSVRARARCALHTNVTSSWSPELQVVVTGGDQGTYVLTLIANPENGGVVQAEPDKELYNLDEKVKITAVPNSNYVFDHWSGDIRYRTDNPTNIYMRRDRTIYANFVPKGGEQISAPDSVIGPSWGYTNTELIFRTYGSSSNLNHELDYQFDWGDGTFSPWGDSVQTHTFASAGTFTVRARARCSIDTSVQSDWSEGLNVTITEPLAENTLEVSIYPDTAGVVQVKPRKDYYAENENVTLYAIPNNGNGILNSNIYIEAETGILTGNFWISEDTSASENRYIFGTEGVPRDGVAEYSFDIEEAGSYYIWGRCYALSGTEDSFFFLLDNGDTLTWHLERNYGVWLWQKVSHQKVEQVFNLETGRHEIKLIKRDLNARLDKLILTRDANFTPEGKMIFPMDEPFSFKFWSGDLEGSDNPVNIIMNTNKEVTANFLEPVYEIVTPPILVSGPDSGFVGDTLTFSTSGAISNLGNPVQYQFDWGDGQLSNWGDSIKQHIFASVGGFRVKTRARSSIDTLVISAWSDSLLVTIIKESVTAPTILIGPDTGYVDKSVEFMAGGAINNKGNEVQYQINWGDSSLSEWGDSIFVHIYSDTGTYYVKARAKSAVSDSVISEWGAPKQILIVPNPQLVFSLSLSVNPEGTGEIVVSPLKEEYSPEDTVSLLAVPNENYLFTRWGGDIDTSENPINLIMDRDYHLVAYFSQIPEFVIKPAMPVGPDSGMIGEQLTFSTSGAACNLGHEVEYQFNWGDSTLSDWGGNTRVHIYAFSDTMHIKARARCKVNTNVISEWSEPKIVRILRTYNFILNISIDPPGSGSVNRTPYKSSYESGEVVILTPLPAPGFSFERWSGDLESDRNPEFLVMDSNKNLTAHFKNITGVEKIDAQIPNEFFLSQNYPNPFNPETTFKFGLPKSSHVRFNIYNIYGQLITNLIDTNLSAGEYLFIWKAQDEKGNQLPSGIYLYQIQAGEYEQIRKMTLLK